MADRKPLVLNAGRRQQIQSGDALVDSSGNTYVGTASEFGTDAVLIISNGTGTLVSASTVAEADVTNALVDISQLQIDVLAIEADYVSAVSAFGTDNRVIRSDGTVRGSQSSGITLDDSDRFQRLSTDFTILFGASAGSGATVAGINNIAIGSSAAASATIDRHGIYIGTSAGQSALGNAESVVMIGWTTGQGATLADQCIGIGESAFFSATVEAANVGIGASCFQSATAGLQNFALGSSAARSANLNDQNVFIGTQSGRGATLEDNNLGIGASSFLDTLGDGSDNIGIGISAFSGTTIGDDNIGIGRSAGRGLNNSGADQNVFIGAAAGTNASQKTDAVNSIAIGFDSFTTADNQVVLGNSNVTQTILRGRVDIGTFIKIPSASELTIATGAVTATQSYHRIDTEADAATDDLDTINGGTEGMVLVLRAENGARDVVVKDGTGNLQLNGDFTMDNTQDTITLLYDGTNWLELCRSSNGA